MPPGRRGSSSSLSAPSTGTAGRDKETRLPEHQPGLSSQDAFERVLRPFRAPTGRSLVFNAGIKLKANFCQGDACAQLKPSHSANLR